jgi:tRNA(Ile)-lysidine synthase
LKVPEQAVATVKKQIAETKEDSRMDRAEDRITRVFLRTLKEYQMVKAGDLVLAAVSGGPDSLSLLRLLCVWREALGITLRAACLDHGLRGEISREESLWVKQACESWDVPCTLGRWEKERHSGLSPQDAARRARRAFLLETLEKIGGHCIAQGHQADDQAETLLMRLIQGSGLQGLGGIWPKQGVWIRPLLFVSREEIEQYCLANGLEPRRDQSNDKDDYLRNRIRHGLLPRIRAELNPNIVETLGRTAAVLQEDRRWLDHCIDREAEKALSTGPGGVRMNLDAFGTLSLSLQRGLIRRAFRLALDQSRRSMDPLPGMEACERVRKLALSGAVGGMADIAGALRVCRTYGYLEFIGNSGGSRLNSETETVLSLAAPGVTCLPDGRRLAARWAFGPKPSAAPGEWVVPWPSLEVSPVLRHRRPGDWIRLRGGSRKLKKYLIDQKTPRLLRNQLWLLTVPTGGADAGARADESQIRWIEGIGAAAAAGREMGQEIWLILQLLI